MVRRFPYCVSVCIRCSFQQLPVEHRDCLFSVATRLSAFAALFSNSLYSIASASSHLLLASEGGVLAALRDAAVAGVAAGGVEISCRGNL